MSQQNTWIDLTGIDFEDVEVLNQEGARAIPEFAASSCDNCSCGTCSCGKQDEFIQN
jgi:hypothetical protein